ncbi:MAG: hydantoinase B/oxoprolinase family protein [Rhodospirillaceae bacterium]|jgi:N-methylhydantoinase B|nr:hydantoinase B/oxoprolinase family protein [Rhodospirillaceae bacterium]
MAVRRQTAHSSDAGAKVDPISLEIVRHELISIPNQIEKNIERTAFSPLVQEYKDYAVGIVGPTGEMITQSRGSLLIFVANALGTAVRDGLEIYGADGLEDGDVVITNHAGTMGQHLNNVVAYTPIRVDGKLLGFFALLVHWIDIGGSVVGSCSSSTATEIWQEGVQFRTVKLISRGKRVAEIFRMIEYNTRFPTLLLGDLEAQIGGCMMGCDLMRDIGEKYGPDAIEQAVSAMRRDADTSVAKILKDVPPGEYRASSFLDDDGINIGKNIPIDVVVRTDGETVTIDLSGLADQLDGPLNAGRNGGAVAAARIALKYLCTPDTPVTEGDYDRLSVEIPDGKFLSAGPEAPIGASGSTIPTVVDTLLRAMADVFPDRVAAAHHGTYGVHAFFGTHPETGALFQNLDTVSGGWGATMFDDGAGPFRSNAHGDTLDVPVERQEASYPYRIDSKTFRCDSAGPGKNRGGLGVEKMYTVLHPCSMTTKFERTQCAPWGLRGGKEGATGGLEVIRASGETFPMLKNQTTFLPGDRVRVTSGGGGGYGNAWEREIERVVADVAQGYVSPEGAARDYGVVLMADGGVDTAATEQRRQDMASEKA